MLWIFGVWLVVFVGGLWMDLNVDVPTYLRTSGYSVGMILCR